MSDILIVDDVPENCRLLASILIDKSYNVRALPSTKFAQKSIQAHPPDLILLDINMPEMDGFSFCRWLKSKVEYADIPIIFLSGSHDEADIIKGFELGAVDYIRKPYFPLEVLKRIENQLKLIEKENELNSIIRETLMESIQAILDILATVDPNAYLKSNKLGRMTKKLVERLLLEETWQYETAALLYHLGDMAFVHDLNAKDDALLQVNGATNLSGFQHAQIIRNIKRLETVADIIDKPKIVKKAFEEQNIIEKGQTLISIVLAFESLEQLKDYLVLRDKLVDEFDMHHSLIDEVFRMYKEDLEYISQDYILSELISGIIVLEDIKTIAGIKLVNKGTQLTNNLINLLRRYGKHKLLDEPIVCSNK